MEKPKQSRSEVHPTKETEELASTSIEGEKPKSYDSSAWTGTDGKSPLEKMQESQLRKEWNAFRKNIKAQLSQQGENLAEARSGSAHETVAPGAPIEAETIPEPPPVPEPPPAAPQTTETPMFASNPVLERVTDGRKSNTRNEGARKSAKAELAAYIAKQKEHEKEVEKRREERSEKFAKEHGLTELRNAKLSAEREAYLEEKEQHKNVFKRFSPGAWRRRSEAREKADEATFAWKKALSEKAAIAPELKSKLGLRNDINSQIYEVTTRLKDKSGNKAELESKLADLKGRLAHVKLSPEETKKARAYYEALTIGKRDTIITPNALRNQAKIDGMSDLSRTLLGKAVGAPAFLAVKALKGMSAVSSGVGKGLFHLNIFRKRT